MKLFSHCLGTLTDVLVDGVDPLDVPRHDVDGGLLRPHLRVEQVVRLETDIFQLSYEVQSI